MPATITEIEKDAPATPQSKEQARPPVPRRPSRLNPFPTTPADEDERFFSAKATQNTLYTSANPTAAQGASAPISVEKSTFFSRPASMIQKSPLRDPM